MHVLRFIKIDAVVELFNGDGLVATCRVAAIRKSDVALDVLTARRDPSPDRDSTLATAGFPRAKMTDLEWLIEKATELGVESNRSDQDPAKRRRPTRAQQGFGKLRPNRDHCLQTIGPKSSDVDFRDDFLERLFARICIRAPDSHCPPTRCFNQRELARLENHPLDPWPSQSAPKEGSATRSFKRRSSLGRRQFS